MGYAPKYSAERLRGLLSGERAQNGRSRAVAPRLDHQLSRPLWRRSVSSFAARL